MDQRRRAVAEAGRMVSENGKRMIAGIVITLSDDADRMPDVFDQITSRAELEVGDYASSDRRIPLTLESEGSSSARDITDWLFSVDGIEFVDVVFVHFDEPGQPREANTDSERTSVVSKAVHQQTDISQ